MSDTILDVEGLKKHFDVPRPFFDALLGKPGQVLVAVDGVSLTVERHETLGLVGESGCGKSTLARCILRLYEPSEGVIIFNGLDITKASASTMRDVRRKMQIVFQDPYSSLNPRMTVRQTLTEVLRFHKVCARAEEETYLQRTMKMVGLTPDAVDKFPKSFSGGQRQRIALARALVMQPTLLVADEPVSALDVSIQAQVLNLLADLRSELGLTLIFIAHELSVVKHVSTRVAVMYLGKIVEMGTTEEVFEKTQHPYTEALLSALPHPVPVRRQRKAALEGDIPSPLDIPKGCRFHPRCPIAEEICRTNEPPLRQISPTHQLLCHLRPSNWEQARSVKNNTTP
jgi:oligopeptide transport system ATP-binding protein